ncbi:MAG TPA: hypothetical protein VGG34_01520 [Opitutaceae bacterium]|jgi:cell wall-associated NlpC family hydrolase
MITAAQLDALDAAAASWRGTPFCEGSPVRGAGISCSHLVAEVLFEAGLTPRIPVPDGPSSSSAILSSESLIAKFIDGTGLFVRMDGFPQGGDVLGFRVGNAVHHAAVMLRGGRLVHSIRNHGVCVAPLIPAEWARRIEIVWRLKSVL